MPRIKASICEAALAAALGPRDCAFFAEFEEPRESRNKARVNEAPRSRFPDISPDVISIPAHNATRKSRSRIPSPLALFNFSTSDISSAGLVRALDAAIARRESHAENAQTHR